MIIPVFVHSPIRFISHNQLMEVFSKLFLFLSVLAPHLDKYTNSNFWSMLYLYNPIAKH